MTRPNTFLQCFALVQGNLKQKIAEQLIQSWFFSADFSILQQNLAFYADHGWLVLWLVLDGGLS